MNLEHEMCMEQYEAEKENIMRCKNCKYYRPYWNFSTPRNDGYCYNLRMSQDGLVNINCHEDWFCADFEHH